MQKLVIQTQYRENYAAHNSGYNHGVDQPHWKFKGGTTYVFPNFQDFNNVTDIVARVTDMITYSHEAAEEYILSWSIVPHSEKVCEDWEFPTNLSFDGDDIIAIKITDNRPNEDGYRYSAMRDEILELTETWTLGPENQRLNYKAEYLMNNGDFVLWEGLRQWFKDAA